MADQTSEYASAVSAAQSARSNAMGGAPHPTTDNNPHVGAIRRAAQKSSQKMGGDNPGNWIGGINPRIARQTKRQGGYTGGV
jgi:hypothetical protein